MAASASGSAAAAKETEDVSHKYDDKQRFRCVACDKFQPPNGKLLSCLHVICIKCARELVERSGLIRCCLCLVETKAPVKGANLIEQLCDSNPVLYQVHTETKSSAATGSKKAGKKAEAKAGKDHSQTLCHVCDEMEKVEVATHQCQDCDGLPLCRQHGESHPRKRFTHGHKVSDLAKAADRRLQPGKKTCILHSGHPLITYCSTCGHALCEKCLSTGHTGHTIDSLVSVAAKQQEHLQSFLNSPSVSGSSLLEKTCNMAAGLGAVLKKTEKVKEEAEELSKKVTTVFDEIERLVEERKTSLLEQIDQELCRQLVPLQKDNEQVRLLLLKAGTIRDITQHLMSQDNILDQTAISLAEVVRQNYEQLSTDLDSWHTTQSQSGVSKIVAKDLSFDAVQDKLKSVGKVLGVYPVDISKSTLLMPYRMIRGRMYEAILRVVDTAGRPVPCSHPLSTIEVSLITPSYEKAHVGICREESNKDQLVARLILIPRKAGSQWLDVRYSDQRKLELFHVEDFVEFDSAKCGSEIVLSSNGQRATHRSQAMTVASVAAETGYDEGRHEWKIRILQARSCNAHMHAGVCRSPEPTNAADVALNFFGVRRYFWCSDGSGHRPDVHARELSAYRMPAWMDGDVIHFVLDCDRETLECHHVRTGVRRIMHDIDCSEELYPALCFKGPMHSAELVS